MSFALVLITLMALTIGAATRTTASDAVTLHRDTQHGQVIFATVSEPEPVSLASAAAIAPVRPPTLAISDPEALAGPEWSDTIAAAWSSIDETGDHAAQPYRHGHCRTMNAMAMSSQRAGV